MAAKSKPSGGMVDKPSIVFMEVFLVLGLNGIALFAVWLMGRKRNGELVRLQEQLSNRDERIQEMQQSLSVSAENEQEQREQLLELHKENSMLRSQCSAIEERMQEANALTTEHKVANKELSLRVQSLAENAATLEEQLHSREEKIAEQQQAMAETRAGLAEYKAVCERQTTQMQELSKGNAAAEEQLSIRQKRLEEHQRQAEEHQIMIKEQAQRIQSFAETCASQEEQLHSRDEKIRELQQTVADLKGSEEHLEQRLKLQFELISNKIIDDSREKVNRFNADKMLELLKPFAKDLDDFKRQMGDAHREQTKERTELETKIKQMVEISQGMSAEAKNLSEALRGNNKAAGNWGETILENILQNSGLTVGKEGYEMQEMLRDESGNPYVNESGRKMIPDAIVHFPDNRNVIIDSKVSIAAYTDYCHAESEEDAKMHLKRHLNSIKAHIDGLNVKSYEQYVDGSLDFVMMFIPNDFAAMVALQGDLTLWQNAYNKKILLISPTNLITSLKIVSDLWSREKQQQNVERILERGQLLYDKCCNFLESFKRVGNSLQSALDTYNTAFKQLGAESGIIRQAEMLKASGIKSKKALALRSEKAEQALLIQEQNEDI